MTSLSTDSGRTRAQSAHTQSLSQANTPFFGPTRLVNISQERTPWPISLGHMPAPQLLNRHRMFRVGGMRPGQLSVGSSPRGVGQGAVGLCPFWTRITPGHATKTVFNKMDLGGAAEGSGSDGIKISCTCAHTQNAKWGAAWKAPEPVFKMNQVHGCFLPRPPPPSKLLA